MKVESLRSGSTSTNLAGSQSTILRPPSPHPLNVLLFGKRPPKLVDRRKHPKLKKALRKLEALKEEIAMEILGEPEGRLSLELCEGSNASISRDGQIAFGVELLEEHQKDDDLLVAVIGHEIGHQPWTWPKGDFSRLTKAQLDAIYREEESKADRFAGRVLAELGADPTSICDFLIAAQRFEARRPTDYYPAEVRAEIIQQAFRRRRRHLEGAAAYSPALGARTRELR